MSSHSELAGNDQPSTTLPTALPLPHLQVGPMKEALFPEGFIWGSASSSYQIEGGHDADGKSESIWDVLCRKPGAVAGDHTGNVACDHYNRYPEDIRIMSSLGLHAYRLSISWPRVMPNGGGAVNRAGLDFYDRLIDSVLAAGIDPWVTLYHWDLPQCVHLRGGWLNRDIAGWFAEYTTAVVERLSDRVTRWMTINEPQVFIGLGYLTGLHAPALKMTLDEALVAGHNCLLAHGRSVSAIREHAKRKPIIGWAPIGRIDFPVTTSKSDIDAARTGTFSVANKDFWNNTWFGDPVCFGHYPEDGLKLFGSSAPRIEPGDMKIIQQPIDFYGANIYSGIPVRAGENGKPVVVANPPGLARNALNWSVYPEALYWGPRFIAERYKLPIVITENGMSNLDWVSEDGRVHDPQRIDYTARYLRALQRACADGVPVQGYFHWSILDNFEWAEGYKDRFGLVHVDYTSLKRTPKDSAYWYRDVIARNGLAAVALAGVDQPADLAWVYPARSRASMPRAR